MPTPAAKQLKAIFAKTDTHRQGWKTFLYNHADGMASIDLFVVPTISSQLLYGLLILQHARESCSGGAAQVTSLEARDATWRSPLSCGESPQFGHTDRSMRRTRGANLRVPPVAKLAFLGDNLVLFVGRTPRDRQIRIQRCF
jgi:hypothetical protein